MPAGWGTRLWKRQNRANLALHDKNQKPLPPSHVGCESDSYSTSTYLVAAWRCYI